jgi:hypothetical protein
MSAPMHEAARDPRRAPGSNARVAGGSPELRLSLTYRRHTVGREWCGVVFGSTYGGLPVL